MISNFFKTSFRNLGRNKRHAIVNILGLTIGAGVFLLIFLVIRFESSFDNFHQRGSLIYRVVREGKDPQKSYYAGTPLPFAKNLKKELPQLSNSAAIHADFNTQVLVPGPDGTILKKFKEAKGVFFSDQQFFEMFSFRFIKGNPATAIAEPNAAILSKELATRYFGSWEHAMGKTLVARGFTVKVTGIIENPPANTDFPLGLVMSYATMGLQENDWVGVSDNNYCFVQLQPGVKPAQLSPLLSGFIQKHVPAENAGYNLVLQPLKQLHFDDRLTNFNGRTFSKNLITALWLIGLFLLSIACINFINLSTAGAVNRAKEVGVRKVLGSSQIQLMQQFFGETAATSLLAICGALLLAVACLPLLNNLLETRLAVTALLDPVTIFFLLGAFILITVLAGFYPALVLSGFNPIAVLRSRMTREPVKGIGVRRALVVFQFVIAQALIIATVVVVYQMDYFHHADMGFNKEAVVTANFPSDSASRLKMDILHDRLVGMPGIKKVSFSNFAPAEDGGWATDLRLTTNMTKNIDLIVNMKPADTSYFSVYHLQLAAGRIYFPSDTMREFVVNETLLKKLSLGTPESVIGKQIVVDGVTAPIVGVVKDFHIHSLKDQMDAVVLTTEKRFYRKANMLIEPGQTKQALASMESLWNSTFPDFVFEYNFVDKAVADYYKQEQQLSQLYKIFAGIAIFISCLGLYGLINFMAVKRRREIGIRKVLGAPVSNIVLLLSREFTVLITIAFLIAAPLAWYFMQQWLQQYSYRIEIGIGIFAATLLFSLVIAWLTVAQSAIKAALANPVKTLKTE